MERADQEILGVINQCATPSTIARSYRSTRLPRPPSRCRFDASGHVTSLSRARAGALRQARQAQGDHGPAHLHRLRQRLHHLLPRLRPRYFHVLQVQALAAPSGRHHHPQDVRAAALCIHARVHRPARRAGRQMRRPRHGIPPFNIFPHWGPDTPLHSAFDLLFTGQTAVIAFLLLEDGDELQNSNCSVKNGWHDTCRWPAFVTQFSALGACAAVTRRGHTLQPAGPATAAITRSRAADCRLGVLLLGPGRGPVAHAHQPVHRQQAEPAPLLCSLLGATAALQCPRTPVTANAGPDLSCRPSPSSPASR